MRKISWPIIHRICGGALSILALAVVCSVSAFAKNNCESNAATINPALAANSGIGGTGLYDGGMGGTGKPESGIGGTGSVADKGGIGGTGIVGVIAGFASICVNGIEVHYSDHTPILVDGRMSTMRELAVGQVVIARAVGTGYELTASNITVIHAAVGPIGSFNSETGEMRVMGQTVRIGAVPGNDQLASLQPGDWVRVSGHRLASGDIVASRIESVLPQPQAHLNGYVAQVDGQGFVVNGTHVRYGALLQPADVARGMEVQVAGHWDGEYLHAQHVLIEPVRQSLGNVEHVVIEGYIHMRDNRELNLSNRVVTLDSGIASDDFRVDQRVQVSGRVGADQRIAPERVEVVNAASVPVFDRLDRDHMGDGGKMKKEVEQDSDNKPSADRDDLFDNSSPDRDESKPDREDPAIQSGIGSELTDRVNDQLDYIHAIGDRHGSQREIEIPDHIRDFSGHHDRLFIDR
jgi:hypothetical protein